MKRARHVSLVTLTVVAAFAAQPPEARQASAPARMPIDVSKLGPRVGEQVPDFSLQDQNGKAWTRESIAGPKGAMLVFFRSADW